MTPAQPSSRIWQFSIKSVLLLTLLVAAFFAGKVSSDKKLAMALKVEKEARKRDAERAKAEAERAARAERMARVQAMRARDQAQAQLYNLQRRLGAEQYLRQEAQAALRHASREQSVSEKVLKKLTALGNELVEGSPGKMAWLDLLKAIDACLPVEKAEGGPAKKSLEITSISSEHHDDLASWFEKLPELSKTRHMLEKDASRPPAAAGRVVTIVVACPRPKQDEPKTPAPLSKFLTSLRERTVQSPDLPPEKGPKRRPFTHVTILPNSAENEPAGTHTVEFVWKD